MFRSLDTLRADSPWTGVPAASKSPRHHQEDQEAARGRWRAHREVIEAIARTFQTGAQWVQLPEKYGNWRGVYNRPICWLTRTKLRVTIWGGLPT
ncbi:transposase [Streptomyces sp. NPDC058718]|uniref:transposase n=1 Tax=Streptomyces sp. NPDC058718 TaxID=3346610 RepID=UPI00368ED94E